MVTRGPRPRAGGPPPSGQHFLKSRKFAAELVVASEIVKSDLVLEIGAGRGKITEELSRRARKVVAVENDPTLANLLIERFKGNTEVLVVIGDALSFPLPAERFRAFGNIPFAITSALLRHLLDNPKTSLERADLIVQLGAAIKRTRTRNSNLLNLAWSGPRLMGIPRNDLPRSRGRLRSIVRLAQHPSPTQTQDRHRSKDLHFLDLVPGRPLHRRRTRSCSLRLWIDLVARWRGFNVEKLRVLPGIPIRSERSGSKSNCNADGMSNRQIAQSLFVWP